MDGKPSEVTDTSWIHSFRIRGKYPHSTEEVGKWLVFVPVTEIDSRWEKVKEATENGLLGNHSKVSTARPNPNATDSNTKVICVYTYDSENEDDLLRVRGELEKLGVKWKIPYKTDQKTLEGKYRIRGDTKIPVNIDFVRCYKSS